MTTPTANHRGLHKLPRAGKQMSLSPSRHSHVLHVDYMWEMLII